MVENVKLKKRLEYIDVYKGIGIFLMVSSHCNFNAEYQSFLDMCPILICLCFL